MNATVPRLSLAAGSLAAVLLAACATEGTAPAPTAAVAGPAPAAVAKLAKGQTGDQIRALLGAPATTKPIVAGEVKGEIWSYPLRSVVDVKMVPVTTQEVAAVNPLTGVSTTRTEPVYQNQEVKQTEVLHLLVVGDRLVEWKVVREEQKQFQN